MLSGSFVISLDFELLWGELDRPEKEAYKANVLGGREAIPHILDLFQKFNIHATWATVGIVLLEQKNELIDSVPFVIPNYVNKMCSAYEHFFEVGNNEIEDPYSFGGSIVNKILEYDGQEIGTHTFSHYYCNEKGADVESFEQDLLEAIKISKAKYGIDICSLVFPRNQAKKEFVDVAKKVGITCWRSNPAGYKVYNNKLFNTIQRVFRLLDSYFPVYGNLCSSYEKSFSSGECMASRMLRPFNHKLAILEPLKIKRIKQQMKYAAKKGKVFHLWWHPHNFGLNTEIMLSQLEDILIYYDNLRREYNFNSVNMRELYSLR